MPGTALKSPENELRTDLRQHVITLMLVATLAFGTVLILTSEAVQAPLSNSLLGFGFVALALLAWAFVGSAPRLTANLLVVCSLLMAVITLYRIDAQAGLLLLTVPGVLSLLLQGATSGTVVALGCVVLALLPGSAGGKPDGLQRLTVLFTIGVQASFIWAATHSAGEALHWWSQTYEQMRSLLEEARSQRLTLKETQEDLVLANQELARVSERLRAMRERPPPGPQPTPDGCRGGQRVGHQQRLGDERPHGPSSVTEQIGEWRSGAPIGICAQRPEEREITARQR